MGDPRKLSKKYKRPLKLWDKSRISEESKLKREYGLKNTREVWIAKEELRRVRREARRSLALPEEEREKAIKKVKDKLVRLNIASGDVSIDDILGLSVRDFLERRLQTLVYRKGLAKTPKQARQLIVHGYIAVDGTRVTAPGYIVTKDKEEKISYYKNADNIFKQPIPASEEKSEESPEEAPAEGEAPEAEAKAE